jgi:hypothetical protein
MVDAPAGPTTHSFEPGDFLETCERPRVGGDLCAAFFQRRFRDGGPAVLGLCSLASNSRFPETETARGRDRFDYAQFPESPSI